MTRHDKASAIALEHIRWCQANDIGPRSIIESVGGKCGPLATWDTAFVAVEMAWLNLGSDERMREAA